MWHITSEEAAEMYARFLAARYGEKAKQISDDSVTRLQKAGDTEGARLWRSVSEKIKPRSH